MAAEVSLEQLPPTLDVRRQRRVSVSRT